jgi:hypothetical protein
MPEAYTRVPDSVLQDARLELSDLRVYAVLSRYTYQSRTPKAMGTRRIAELSRLSRNAVYDSLERLEERKHIQVAGEGDFKIWREVLDQGGRQRRLPQLRGGSLRIRKFL